MEQKTFYVAPEAKLSAAKIRCSILAGSNGNGNGQGQQTEWTEGGGGTVLDPKPTPKDPDDARRRLSF